jgi:hypothetical protein
MNTDPIIIQMDDTSQPKKATPISGPIMGPAPAMEEKW